MITSPDRRVTWRFVRAHPAHFIAFAGGVGLAHVAPGTFGTLIAFPLFALLRPALTDVQFLLLLLAMLLLGMWACEVTGRALGVSDHEGMVWDEFVAFLIVLFFSPTPLVWQAFAFLFFRLFGIFKPFPIRALERRFANGFGAMADDLVAAFYALLLLAALKAVVG